MKNLILLTYSLLFCAVSFAQPIITTFAPETGPIGSSVTITGTGFNTTANQNIVFFGATQATVTAASTDSLTVIVPLGATYQYISVTNLGVNLTAYSAKPFIVTLAGDIMFTNKVDFGTGIDPNSVSIADIDGDGKSDLVVVNSTSNTISIFRNTSSPSIVSFANKVDFGTGTSPSSASIADIDGDGKLDLAITNSGNNTVSVFRNTSTSGGLSFDAPINFTTGNSPKSISIGDIDGDGKPDLAVTNYNSNTVSVLRNTSIIGIISFANKVDFGVSSNPSSIIIGDIDGDEKPDLAVVNYGNNTIYVLHNTSISGFIAFATPISFTTGTGPHQLNIGDIDGDGKPDLVVAIITSPNFILSVFRNTSTIGTISFATKADFSGVNTLYPMSIGDIDGDGKLDLTLVNSSVAFVLRNTSTIGTISFATRVEFSTGTSSARSVGIGDIDGDGKPDLVATVSNSLTNTHAVVILRQTKPLFITSFNPTSGVIGSTVTIVGTGFSPSTAQNIVFFGATKAVVTAASDTSLMVIVPVGATYQNISVTNLQLNATAYSSQPFIATLNGHTLFANKQDFSTNAQPNSVGIADLNGDGKPDLAVTNGNSNIVAIFRNTSTSNSVSFATPVNFTTGIGPVSVSIGDLNGDGKLDLVVANSGNGRVSVFQNISSSGVINFVPKVDYSIGGNPISVVIEDIDGNTKPDLVVANQTGNVVTVLRNTCIFAVNNISFANAGSFVTGTAPRSISVRDIDGDGKPDLAVANYVSNTVSILRNTSILANISFAPKVDFATANNPYSVSIGDIDLDGKPDLAVANYGSNSVSVLQNTSSIGIPSFATKVDFTTGSAPISVSIGDINGNGLVDLAVANNNSNNVSILDNTSTLGNINFAPKVDFTTGTTPYAVSIGDINMDGKPDLAVPNYNSNTVSVLQQIIPPPTIASFSPSNGCTSNASVVITGTYFSGVTGVTFGGVNALNFTVNSETQITATVGSGTSGTITVTTLYGTVESIDTFIVNPLPIVALGADTSQCLGSIILDAGNIGLTYIWSTGETSQTINTSISNNYSVTVTDALGCSKADTIHVAINSLPIVSLGVDSTFCGSALLNAGNVGSTYLWSNATTTQTINVSSPNTYSVTVTDGNNCSNADTINIAIISLPTVSLGPDVSQCLGTVTLNAGNIGSTYLWSTAETTQTINVSSTSTYSVTVTDGNSCSNTDMVNVAINPLPTVALGPDIAACAHKVLNAGNPGSTYLWSTNATTQSINTLFTGTYSVTVVNGNGCSNSDTINVTINPLPTVSLGPDAAFCVITLLDAGNTGATYKWSNGATTQTINVNNTGYYAVTVIDGNNCSNTDMINITINPLPTVYLGPDIIACKQTTLQTGNIGTYLWSTAETTHSINVVSSGTYTVTVTNSQNCSNSDQINVTINAPDVTVTTIGSTIIANQNGATYQWINCFNNAPLFGQTSQSFTTNNSLNYAVIVTLNGCADTSNCVNTIAITEIQDDNAFSIAPNPFSKQTTLTISYPLNNANFVIYNSLGEAIKEIENINTQEVILNRNDLPNGVYFIRLMQDKKLVAMKKVVVTD